MRIQQKLGMTELITVIKRCKENELLVSEYEEKGVSLLLSSFYNHANFYVEWLLENGANVNVLDKEGNSPLRYAVIKSEPKIIKQIAAKTNDEIKTNSSALFHAINAFKYNNFIALVELGFPLENKNGKSLLLTALEHLRDAVYRNRKTDTENLLHIVNYLIQNNASIGDKEISYMKKMGEAESILESGVVREAYELEMFELVRVFIQNGISAHRSNATHEETVCETFIKKNDKEWVEFILDNSEDKKIPHTRYILRSMQNPEMLEVLLKKGVNPNKNIGLTDGTLQQIAKSLGKYYNKKSIELLLQYGADVNKKSRYEWTAIVELLIVNSAHSNKQHEFFNLIMEKKPALLDIDISRGLHSKPEEFPTSEPHHVWDVFELAISQNRYDWFKPYIKNMTEEEQVLYEEKGFLNLLNLDKGIVKLEKMG